MRQASAAARASTCTTVRTSRLETDAELLPRDAGSLAVVGSLLLLLLLCLLSPARGSGAAAAATAAAARPCRWAARRHSGNLHRLLRIDRDCMHGRRGPEAATRRWLCAFGPAESMETLYGGCRVSCERGAQSSRPDARY